MARSLTVPVRVLLDDAQAVAAEVVLHDRSSASSSSSFWMADRPLARISPWLRWLP